MIFSAPWSCTATNTTRIKPCTSITTKKSGRELRSSNNVVMPFPKAVPPHFEPIQEFLELDYGMYLLKRNINVGYCHVMPILDWGELM